MLFYQGICDINLYFILKTINFIDLVKSINTIKTNEFILLKMLIPKHFNIINFILSFVYFNVYNFK